MSTERYDNKIKAQIGRVTAQTIANNYFPLVGSQVRIEAQTKWAQSAKWETQNGNGETIATDGSLEVGSDSIAITVTADGELQQNFTARNAISQVSVSKIIYAIQPQNDPYFDVKVSREIVRADGEVSEVLIEYENGYNGTCTAQVRLYRENQTENPLRTFTNMTSTENGKKCEVSFNQAADRGIYDVEVDLTDSVSRVSFTKRINKLITVTPRLAPEPADRTVGYRDIFATSCFTTYSPQKKVTFNIRLWESTGEGLHYAEVILPSGEQNGTSYYDSIDISALPCGTTLVLKDDPLEEAGYTRRLIFKGNSPPSVSAESGTPNNTYEKPLVITINQQTAYEIPFQGYSGWNFENNVRHVVIDGRGYHNIDKGIHIHKCAPDAFGQNCMFMVNGTSEIELFAMEFSDCDFTAISGKTDPDPNRPWYWYGNWAMENLRLHHIHIHDIHAEGFYLGYFSPETQTKVNSSGASVTFRPHSLDNTRIYRLRIDNCGYDAVQLSNARNAEVCYNEVYNSSWRGDKDQMSGISIQSVSGKCYNNTIRKFQGPGIQVGPLGELEIFNNIVSGGSDGQSGIQFLFTSDTPEQNPDGNNVNNTLKIYIHNNVIVCNGCGVNGRNTVQVMGVYFEDNIMVYKHSVFGNMIDQTLQQWEAQARGNLYIRQNVLDYAAIDACKIADSANGNFQIAHNSELIGLGEGELFRFDFRGYKQWYSGLVPCGAFMGIYKDSSAVQTAPVLESVSINEGADSTQESTVSVSFAYTGIAADYRISTDSAFADAPWHATPECNTVQYILRGDTGERTLYVQLRNSRKVSEVKSDSILFINNYGGKLSYDTFAMHIPLADLESGIESLEVSIPPCKYGKSFALSLTSDDSLLGVYSKVFNYVMGRYVDNLDIYHKGMATTSGITPSRSLTYTDGCGNRIPLRMSSAWNKGNPGYDTHKNGNNYLATMWWSEGRRFADFGNGLMNHGGGDQSKPMSSITDNATEMVDNIGHYPYMLVIPGGTTGYAEAAALLDDIYAMESTEYNSKGLYPDLGSVTGDLFQRRFGRVALDTMSLDNIKSILTANAHGNIWINLFCHNIKNGTGAVNGQLNTQVCFDMLDYICDTYGSEGDDTVWFASNAEIYEHLFARLNSIIEKRIEGDKAVVTVRAAKLPHFRYGELSLRVRGATTDNVKILGDNIKNVSHGGRLVNVLYCDDATRLADAYTLVYESSQDADTLADAMFFVLRLSEELRAPYLERIAAIQTAPVLCSVRVNSGAEATTSREVSLMMDYSGVVTEYRVGEDADLSAAAWTQLTNLSYTLSSGYGVKIIYTQVRNSYGESAVVSCSIRLEESAPRHAIISLGWDINDIPNSTLGLSAYDAATGITRFQSQNLTTLPRTIYDVTGVAMGSAVTSSNGPLMVSNFACKGAVTGDDRGLFPDTYLAHNSAFGGNAAGHESITLTIASGVYRVSLLCNTLWSQRPIPYDALAYRIATDTDTVNVALPASGVQNNTSKMTEPVIITVGPSGMLKVEFGLTPLASAYYYVPLNIIKIEQI